VSLDGYPRRLHQSGAHLSPSLLGDLPGALGLP
jgi:hypothetical protein